MIFFKCNDLLARLVSHGSVDGRPLPLFIIIYKHLTLVNE